MLNRGDWVLTSNILGQIVRLNKETSVVFKQGLLFCILLFSQPVLSNVNSLSVTAYTPVWQTVVADLPSDKGIFNAALRKSMRDKLELPSVIAADLEDKKQLLSKVKPRLIELDKALSKFIRVSENSTRFEQLKRLMPALLNIEERKLIQHLLKKHKVRLPNLRNSRLLPFLDKRITLLANSMIFNMKALVRERRDYEPDLLKAMASYGVKFSARPPDFILDYLLLGGSKNEQGERVFEGNIALLGQYEIPVVKIEEVIVTDVADWPQAEASSVAVMAKLITMQLKQFLVEKAY